MAASQDRQTDPAAAAPARSEREVRQARTARLSRASADRYVANDRLEGMYYIPPGVIPDELQHRWVRIMRTQTVPDEANYQQAVSQGYVELDVNEFPELRRMRSLRPMPGFENCEIRGGLMLMIRDKRIGIKEREVRMKRFAAQMRGIAEWVQDNAEEAAHRLANPNFQRFDKGSPVEAELVRERVLPTSGGPAEGMFKE